MRILSSWEVVDVRWFLLSVFSLLFPVLCSSQVLLNEVYYDHAGTDEGYEFIELVNLADSPRSLEAYAIEFHDGASAGWVTIWRASPTDTAAAGGLFVLGGEYVVPPPDAHCELGLQNGPDAVRLVAGGHVVDLLGYGALGDAQYFEGAPAPDAESGTSLARHPDGADSDDNESDFSAAAPSPGRFNTSRHDVALRLAATTPCRDARPDAGVEVLSFSAVNLGIEPVGSGAVTVVVADSTDLGEMPALSVEVSGAIPAGDSARVEIAVDLSLGTHRLRASAIYGADDRPENDALVIWRRVGASPLVVSEVMSYPRSGCPEYVELFNGGAVPYDLLGHRIHDAAHAPELIVTTERIIPPGGFAVLTSDAEGLSAWFPKIEAGVVVEIEGRWPTLNQTGGAVADSIVILDGALLPVERVAYPPQPADTGGRSLERVDLYPGPGPHTWVLASAAAGGSPGERSPNSSVAPPEGRCVSVSPNPFDPYRCEVLVVTVPPRDEPERVVVGVFDIAGRRIADLGTAAAFPSTLVWDGEDSEGGTVLPGIYVLACEFFSVTNGSRRVERVVVGCGRRNSPGGSH